MEFEQISPPATHQVQSFPKLSVNDCEKVTLSTKSPTDRLLSPCSKQILVKKINAEGKKSSESGNIWAEEENFPQPYQSIILGSSSVKRKSVLERNGWSFTTASPDIDEKAIRDDDPLILPLLVAKAKASALTDRLTESILTPTILLTSDQIVLFKQEIREKPQIEEEAREFLSSYSNDTVSTVTAVTATHLPSGRQSSDVNIASVSFKLIPEETVETVLATAEVYSSAGALVIENEVLRGFIQHIEGDIDSLRGLPMRSTVRCIHAVTDIPVTIEDPTMPNTENKLDRR
eukprot:CAMPEP_0182421192 /NCGR_PEP_ID=MMETSP1167-20130531/6455_1 /TAXON_ID=2988 /ORGANISM="Mallomonas Sp, Strain CCMP3275" /LENGTH=289 /DNA_ID=CAMNT_0024598065 /DNA_START=134 /DNA_END=1003 /DNA_ORIENTATION=+